MKGPGGSMSYVLNNSYQSITNTAFVNYKKMLHSTSNRSDNVYQLLARVRRLLPPLKLVAMI